MKTDFKTINTIKKSYLNFFKEQHCLHELVVHEPILTLTAFNKFGRIRSRLWICTNQFTIIWYQVLRNLNLWYSLSDVVANIKYCWTVVLNNSILKTMCNWMLKVPTFPKDLRALVRGKLPLNTSHIKHPRPHISADLLKQSPIYFIFF